MLAAAAARRSSAPWIISLVSTWSAWRRSAWPHPLARRRCSCGYAAAARPGETVLFGKLYALSHLRSDRWYKLARTVIYGRLEDEKPFSTVRRLVEYEDHLLRLMRDAGLPTPAPYGFAEITPEREYLIVMEFFAGAREMRQIQVDDQVIDDALRVVRRMWDAGMAHRDIKPSNVLVRGSRVLLIDVAFAAVRPTPWRQAVDLANMMLTLALGSTAGACLPAGAGRFRRRGRGRGIRGAAGASPCRRSSGRLSGPMGVTWPGSSAGWRRSGGRSRSSSGICAGPASRRCLARSAAGCGSGAGRLRAGGGAAMRHASGGPAGRPRGPGCSLPGWQLPGSPRPARSLAARRARPGTWLRGPAAAGDHRPVGARAPPTCRASARFRRAGPRPRSTRHEARQASRSAPTGPRGAR